MYSRVLGSDESRYVLIEELEDKGNAVGEHEVLAHEFKLVTRTRTNHSITTEKHAEHILTPEQGLTKETPKIRVW